MTRAGGEIGKRLEDIRISKEVSKEPKQKLSRRRIYKSGR